jgi:HNH endonuclease
MDPFVVSHLSHRALLLDTRALVAQDRKTTAMLLARLIEIEDRKLHVREGHASMHAFCVRELRFSDGVAYKYINAARAARKFPAILVAVYEGRLHLRGVLMLAPYLPFGNATELLAAATHKTCEEIELLLAERFPRPDVPERLEAIPPPPAPAPMGAQWESAPAHEHAPGHAFVTIPEQLGHCGATSAWPMHTGNEPPTPRARMTPLSPGRFGLRVTIDDETQDLLQRARAFMSNPAPNGEIAPVIKSALRLFVTHHEQRKYAATDRPRPHSQCAASNPRHIAASVKRAVRERDGDQCAYVSESGQRCSSRARLEFDHIEPVARGGASTAENLRLLCRVHNQYAAERAFGAEFMAQKRAEAKRPHA